jgi:geranylgeranyl diphosphate synthase type I
VRREGFNGFVVASESAFSCDLACEGPTLDDAPKANPVATLFAGQGIGASSIAALLSHSQLAGPSLSRPVAPEKASSMTIAGDAVARQDTHDQGRKSAESFAAFADRIKRATDQLLERFVDDKIARRLDQGQDVASVLTAFGSLALRGGKRFRAVLVGAGYEACGGEGGADAVHMAGVAMELLQTYLLIHDDWMDQDEVRRGGPTVHMMLREKFGGPSLAGDTGAILAGDFCSAFALVALLAVPAKVERLMDAARIFAAIQQDVVAGQVLDVRARSLDGAAVERMHDLKTGSYTVRGPLAIGAALAGADEAYRQALHAFAMPLGVAFQLRDDLLGTFGDPGATGKGVGSDLRQGKRTALVLALEGDSVVAPLVERVLGVSSASDADVQALVDAMVARGARARVEKRLDDLLAQARQAAQASALPARGKDLLMGAVSALGVRDY